MMATWASGYMWLNKVDWDLALPFVALQSQRTALAIQGEAEAQTHRASSASNPVETWQ